MPEATADDPRRIASGRAPTISVVSLGCRANQEEVECLLGTLRDRGFATVPFGSPADWIVVNTCSVTGVGESDARQTIRRAARLSGGGRVVVTGCFAQRDPEAAARIGADIVVGNADKWRIPELIDSARRSESFREDATAGCTPIVFKDDPTVSRFLRHGRSPSGFRTRASLKVQDGCDERCTYCIIPSLRGRSVSRPVDEVIEEARTLVASGHAEITLTGIHTASFDAKGTRLSGLLRLLLDVEGLRRIRVNSLEPQWVDEELIATLASSSRFCRHLHLPLQSGDDRVLKKMGRGYTGSDYRALVARARERIPGVAIGADVMAGFPGEDEEAASNTRALLESVRPAYLHVFPYSPRPGTAALRLSGAVSQRAKEDRVDRLHALDERFRLAFLAASEGEVHEVLVEDKRGGDGLPQATTDTAIRVRISAPAPAATWARVRLRATGSTRSMAGDLQ